MKAFMDENFLLETESARTLYHKFAKDMPIFDYHCHLPPDQIAVNQRYKNLYEIWLSSDHYKWRAMRSFGIDEKYISGDAQPFDKFLAFARMIPHTIGNPLYHWTHMELRKYFNIHSLLNEHTAKEIWDKSAKLLASEKWGAADFIEMSGVKVLCTTDDPADNLEHHRTIAGQKGLGFKVLPTFRPDKAMAVQNPKAYSEYIAELGKAAGKKITSFTGLLSALEERHSFFHKIGARISDHGLTNSFYTPASDGELEKIFQKIASASQSEKPVLSNLETEKIQTAVLTHTARINRERGWTMQLHIGAIRNTNSRMFKQLGPDTGYDSIGDQPLAEKLAAFLDSVETSGGLPKTIIYILNPADNYVIGTMIGNFQDGSVPGKIQFGSGWWFNDQRDGIMNQMKALANLGLLTKFVGMLTDSRSFLSFPRHEYFRRILCNLVGAWVENGEFPWDEELLGGIIQDICFRNAETYFNIDLK